MDYKHFNDIPGPRGLAALPGIGPAFLFKPFTDHVLTRPDLMFEGLDQVYGKIVRLQMPFGPAVLLGDTHDMLTVFHNEGKYPVRPAFDLVETYLESRQIKTLSTLNGESWRHLRMRVQPHFLGAGAEDHYIPALERVADDLTECAGRLGESSQQDFRDIVFLYIVECLCQFCFNHRTRAISATGVSQKNEIADKVKLLVDTVSKPQVLPLHRLWKTKAYTAVETSMDFLIGLSRSEVKNTLQKARDKTAPGEESQSCPYMVRTLLESADLSDEEVAMGMSDFFFGGTDTTSRNLSILLFHIAANPEQQQLLYQEIQGIVGSGSVTKDMLHQMNFVKACVKESLRLVFPLTPGPCRYLAEDLILSGYKVPKGTLAMFNNVAYLHDPANVDCPREFRPQRWLRNANRKSKEAIPSIAHMPFGMGSRSCLGRRFAQLMMHLCLIKLVQNFELRLAEDPSTYSLQYQIFPTTNKPLVLRFIPRNGTQSSFASP